MLRYGAVKYGGVRYGMVVQYLARPCLPPSVAKMVALRRSNLSNIRCGNYLKCLARLPLTWENDRLEHIDFLRLNLP